MALQHGSHARFLVAAPVYRLLPALALSASAQSLGMLQVPV